MSHNFKHMNSLALGIAQGLQILNTTSPEEQKKVMHDFWHRVFNPLVKPLALCLDDQDYAVFVLYSLYFCKEGNWDKIVAHLEECAIEFGCDEALRKATCTVVSAIPTPKA